MSHPQRNSRNSREYITNILLPSQLNAQKRRGPLQGPEIERNSKPERHVSYLMAVWGHGVLVFIYFFIKAQLAYSKMYNS